MQKVSLTSEITSSYSKASEMFEFTLKQILTKHHIIHGIQIHNIKENYEKKHDFSCFTDP